MKFPINWTKAIIIAFCLGLLEAAWTTPTMGGPRDAILGCFAIAVTLLLVTWPKPWRILGLAILEEGTQGFVGTLGVWHPTAQTFFNHWSTQFIGFNLYPWITFPLLTIIGEIVFKYRYKIHKHNEQFMNDIKERENVFASSTRGDRDGEWS